MRPTARSVTLDVARMMEFYEPEAAFYFFPASAEAVMTGRDAIAAQMKNHFSNHPGLRTTIVNRISSGNFVIESEHLTGLKAELMGGETETFGVTIYELRNGRIRRVWLLDPARSD